MNEYTFLTTIIINITCIVTNIPFGMLRYKTKKFSILWFLCIHAPIPLTVLMRKSTNLSLYYIPILLIFSIIGQVLGNTLMKKYLLQKKS